MKRGETEREGERDGWRWRWGSGGGGEGGGGVGGGGGGGGSVFCVGGGGVSHCELSAVIILLRHLRRGMPHPSAHAFVAHGNCRVVYLCERVSERVCVCLCRTLEVMRCTRMHVSPGYGAVELWLPQHLID